MALPTALLSGPTEGPTCASASNDYKVQLPPQLGRESRAGPDRGVPIEHTPFHPAEPQRAAAGRAPFLRETK